EAAALLPRRLADNIDEFGFFGHDRLLREASRFRKRPVCSPLLKEPLPKRLQVEALLFCRVFLTRTGIHPAIQVRGRFSIENAMLPPFPDIDKMAGDCGRRGHGGRDEMGAALKALAALEIAVRGRGAALLRLQLVGVHGEAHRAARLAPLEAGLDEDL